MKWRSNILRVGQFFCRWIVCQQKTQVDQNCLCIYAKFSDYFPLKRNKNVLKITKYFNIFKMIFPPQNKIWSLNLPPSLSKKRNILFWTHFLFSLVSFYFAKKSKIFSFLCVCVYWKRPFVFFCFSQFVPKSEKPIVCRTLIMKTQFFG